MKLDLPFFDMSRENYHSMRWDLEEENHLDVGIALCMSPILLVLDVVIDILAPLFVAIAWCVGRLAGLATRPRRA